jgi:hypothetical protein
MITIHIDIKEENDDIQWRMHASGIPTKNEENASKVFQIYLAETMKKYQDEGLKKKPKRKRK